MPESMIYLILFERHEIKKHLLNLRKYVETKLDSGSKFSALKKSFVTKISQTIKIYHRIRKIHDRFEYLMFLRIKKKKKETWKLIKIRKQIEKSFEFSKSLASWLRPQYERFYDRFLAVNRISRVNYHPDYTPSMF